MEYKVEHKKLKPCLPGTVCWMEKYFIFLFSLSLKLGLTTERKKKKFLTKLNKFTCFRQIVKKRRQTRKKCIELKFIRWMRREAVWADESRLRHFDFKTFMAEYGMLGRRQPFSNARNVYGFTISFPSPSPVVHFNGKYIQCREAQHDGNEWLHVRPTLTCFLRPGFARSGGEDIQRLEMNERRMFREIENFRNLANQTASHLHFLLRDSCSPIRV